MDELNNCTQNARSKIRCTRAQKTESEDLRRRNTDSTKQNGVQCRARGKDSLKNATFAAHMSRSFVKNLIWLQALNWLVKPFWILWIERTVQNQLGSEWYGTYFVHFNVGLLFAVLLDAGLNSYVAREVAQNGKLSHWKRFLYLRLFLGGIYMIGILAISVYQNLDSVLIALVVLNQLLASVILTIRAVLQGRHLFVSDAILSVLDRLIAVIICGFLFWGMSDSFQGFQGIKSFLLSQSVGYFVALLFGGYLLRFKNNSIKSKNLEERSQFEVSSIKSTESKLDELKSTPEVTNIAVKTSESSYPSSNSNNVLSNSINQTSENQVSNSNESSELRPWLKGVFWFMAMALSMSIFTRIDALMIRNLGGGYEAAGDYAKSYRLLDAALIFSTLLSSQLLPMFSQKLTKGDSNHGLLSGGFRLVIWVSSSAFLFVFLLGNDVLQELYNEDTSAYVSRFPLHLSYSHWVFILLMGSFIPMSLVHVFGTYITALGKMKWLTFLSVVTMGLNITLNYILLPSWGIAGAAASCLGSQLFFSGMCFLYILRHKHFTWTWKHVRMVFMVVVLFVVVIISLWMYIDGATASLIETKTRRWILLLGWMIFVIGTAYIFFFKDLRRKWITYRIQ